jgi:hypothetical protein
VREHVDKAGSAGKASCINDRFGARTLSLTGALLPQHYDEVSTYCELASFGKVALMLWLVIRGAKPPALEAATLSSAVA